jgi:hypothetical protein
VFVGWQIWTGKFADPIVPPGNSSTSTSSTWTAQPPDSIEAPFAERRGPLKVIDPAFFAERLASDPDCYVHSVVLDPETGEPVDAIACDRQSEPHPYETWSEPVLAGLAYGDPVAAEVLGLRHIQSEDPNQEALGLMLLYRSVALSGDTEILHRAIGKRYATVSMNGEPDVHNLKQLLVFAVVATRLGDTDIRPHSIEARLAKAEIPTAEVSRLKQAAERILREMASIENEVTGNTTIREALNNA